MTEWKVKREEWAQVTAHAIESLSTDPNPLTFLASAEKAARDAAAKVLGMSGGRRNTLIPFHSERFRKLTALLRIVKSARKDMAQRCQGTVAGHGPGHRRCQATVAAPPSNLCGPRGTGASFQTGPG